ncbi:hypothetical protein [Nocardia nepalensis]
MGGAAALTLAAYHPGAYRHAGSYAAGSELGPG